MVTRKLTAAERIQKRAAELVLRGWCKGHMAELADGEICSATHPHAVKWCISGALVCAAGGRQHPAFETAEWAVHARLPKRWQDDSIVAVNDDRIRSARQAAELLWPGSTKGAK